MSASESRGSWASRVGFVLAAAGSAVGLGNIWKFPYVTGENGGGLFVVIYLLCVGAVGLPIMVAEVLMGRASQCSPVAAFRHFTRKGHPWAATGWLGVASGFVILSFYSVVAGWTLHYVVLSLSGTFSGLDDGAVTRLFADLSRSPVSNVTYHGLFIGLSVAVVFGGVQGGIERWSRILMPALFVMLLLLVGYSATLPGFGQAMEFLFAPHADKLRAAGFLQAMGQAFFSLSLGMGAMLTYGSYLSRETGILKASLWIAFLDTAVALLAGIVVFPIIFSSGLKPEVGPGLVFVSLPIAFSGMPGGHVLSIIFFVLLVFAALTSSISLLEVVTSSLIDLYGWRRRQVCVGVGLVTFLFGVPSALSGGDGFFGKRLLRLSGRTFFDWMDEASSNWMLPLGGLLIALFVGFVMRDEKRREQYRMGSTWGGTYSFWLALVRFFVPLAVLLVFLQSTGILRMLGVAL